MPAALIPFLFIPGLKSGKEKHDSHDPANITWRLHPEENAREKHESGAALKGLACPWLLLILFGVNPGYEGNLALLTVEREVAWFLRPGGMVQERMSGRGEDGSANGDRTRTLCLERAAC